MIAFLSILLPVLPVDTISEPTQTLDEVVVISVAGEGRKRSSKGQTASIDEHLGELSHVDLVRRGSYAWEPVVNNMATERVSTTIDGMKIFYACTDKMDPVTSYVESSNLQSILLNSGLNGNPQSTGNIGGSLDLKLKHSGFDAGGLDLNSNVGYESNGHLQVYGTDVSVSTHRLYTNAGIFYRHADNYRQGGGKEVLFSQFRKVNVYDNFGISLTEDGSDIIEGTFIYDRADNVGYPALNMDVLKAEAFITALTYTHQFKESFLESWETKAYYNHITHIMDDTHRPDVEIHMDMPGKSWTSGIYSLLTGSSGHHDVKANYDLYYNRLFADMTMYPGGAAPMYMVTWPDVGTLNTGVALTDRISLTNNQSVTITTKWAMQWQRLNNEEGYHALKVFFPGMKDAYHQVVGRVAATYLWSMTNSRYSIGAGWGSRAPTVTEAYGYYLNNTFDQYDYIGNPHLKNESAVELTGSTKWSLLRGRLSIGLDANAFFFANYIIGKFEERLSPMTVDAEGVKVYANLSHATIVNTSLSADWIILPWLRWNTRLDYAIGRDEKEDPLPLISPFAYRSSLNVTIGSFQGKAELKGNARQVNYGRKYGETCTPAYAIVNLSGQYNLNIKKHTLILRAGVENLLDKSYHTYSDWCNIPQKGRNLYVNLNWMF